MPKILKLCFDPDNPDSEKSTSIVVDMGWTGNCRCKTERISRKAGKKTYEHLLIVKGI